MAQRRQGRKPDAGGAAAPQGAPRGPRRPAAPAGSRAAGKGENRPSPSLVPSTKSSTPDLMLRIDDIGRGFLYEPTLGTTITVPEPQCGPRVTERLTERAARQIKGAAIKAVNIGSPLRTFMTFTMRPEAREQVASGEIVVGHEMRRTLNALAEGERRKGRPRLIYLWVAENPHDDNPHVHLLTSHRVPRAEFEAFASRVESLWSHGWVKIERIRKPEGAGRYILKAVGYALKGGGGSQGTVYGNRYGIARAIIPKYDTVALYDCADAAVGLRAFQAEMTEDVQQLGDEYLTRHGLSFPAGTNLGHMYDVVGQLGRGNVVDK